MEHVRMGWMFVVVLGLLVLESGCGRAVAGAPSAAPGALPAAPATAGRAPSSAARARAPTLQADVLADECLLDAEQFGALLGRRVRAGQSVVQRDDGTRSTSCYAGAVDGPQAPLAALNVYRVQPGTPAEFVRAAGGRALEGVGEAAKLIETAGGPTLQVAGRWFLVTLVVQGRSPPDAAWRAAAAAALARLPA
jgi:hypothetical protein